MARKGRNIKRGARYHSLARINRQEMVFEQICTLPEVSSYEQARDYFKNLFMTVVAEAKTKYKFNLSCFCIMGNHVHFIIKPLEDESLSKIMQWLLSVFAVRFNKIFGYKGHVWYDRFKSYIIEGFEHFQNVFFYITNNPVRANIVKSPYDYPYNAINYFDRKDYSILDPPDEELNDIIDRYKKGFSEPKAREVDTTIGFHNKKPGRKPGND